MQPRIVCCQLLTMILLTNKMTKSHVLWNQFKARLCDNVKYKFCYMSYYQANQEILKNDIYDYSLQDLNRILVRMEKSLVKFLLIPLSQQQWSYRISNPLLQTKQYNVNEITTLIDEQKAMFNPEQATAFDTVLESVTNNQGYFFFIYATGSYRKIFLCNTIAAKAKRRRQIALYIVLSRITTLLLNEERTFYLYFKISLSINKDSIARLKWNSYMFLVI